MHHEGTAGLGHGAQVDGVAHQLGFGALRLDDLFAVTGGGHAHDAAAALVEIAEDIAHVLIGHGDLQLADRLKQNGGGFGHGCLVSEVGSGLERDFGGVNGVIGTVIKDGLEVDDGITGERTVQAGFAQTLFHGGEEVLGDGAAEDFLGEDHLFGLLIRLKADPNVTELTAAAGLLLMATLLLDGLADLFTVGNARRVKLGIHAEAALELGAQNVDLNIACAGNDDLVRLGVVGDGEGRIFLVQTVETGAELILLTAGLGSDGAGVAGLGKVHALEHDDVLRVAQRVAGPDAVHLGDGADVAAADLLDFLVLLALDGIETPELFGVAGRGIVEGHVACDLAAHDLDEGVLAVLVGDGLEDDGGGGAVFIVSDLDVLAVVVLGGFGIHVGGDGDEVDNGLHQHVNAETGGGAAAEHGRDAAVLDAELETLGDLGVGKLHGVEELFHQLFIGAGGGFHQLGAGGFRLILDGGGDGALNRLAALDLVGLVVQQVNDRGDMTGVVRHGSDDGGNGGAELLLQGGEAGVVIGVVFIGAVDEDHAGLLAQHLPAALRTDGKTVLGAADEDRALTGADGGERFAGKVEVAGSVEDVDLDVLIFDGGDCQGNGDASLDLLGIVVAGGIAVGNLAETVRAAGKEKHALSERGLAAAAVTEQADVAYVFSTHRGSSPSKCQSRAGRYSTSELYNKFSSNTTTIFSNLGNFSVKPLSNGSQTRRQ